MPDDRRVLSSIHGYRSHPVHPFYDVTADHQRLVMIRDRGAETPGDLIVVENLFEESKEQAGT